MKTKRKRNILVLLLATAMAMTLLSTAAATASSNNVNSYEGFVMALDNVENPTDRINIVGTFDLENNITINKSVIITSSVNATIAANGYTMTIQDNAGAATDVILSGNVRVTGSTAGFVVNTLCSLSLTESAAISVLGGDAVGINVNGGSVVVASGDTALNGGSILASGTGAYGIIAYGGNVMVNSGAISAAGDNCQCIALRESSTATITGGTVSTLSHGNRAVVVSNSEATITGGEISAAGDDNSRGMIIQAAGTVTITGGTVSGSILLAEATLNVTAASDLHIDSINFHGTLDSVEGDYLYLQTVPDPVSAILNRKTTVTLEGVGDGAYFQHRVQAAGSPYTSPELNASIPFDSENIFTLAPSSVGAFNLVLLGTAVGSNTVYLTVPVTVDSGFAGGSGTQTDPFQIASAAQLNHMRDFLGSANSGKYFELTANIELNTAPYNTGEGWEPIGNYDDLTTYMFYGHFDGDGYTLSGLNINRPTKDCIGLFGACCGADILNLGVTGANVIGGRYTGALAGYITDGSVAGCYATGTVTAIGTYCDAGGLVGIVSSSTVTSSYAAVNVTTDFHAGGLAAVLSGSSAAIANCYATGGVIATGESGTAGGLTGTSYSSVTNCYASGAVTAAAASGTAGGLVGANSGTVTASYYNSQTSGQSDSDRGTPETSTDMVLQATFSGWDFTAETGIWAISEGASYPYLRTMVPASLPTPPMPTGISVTPETLTLNYGGAAETLTPSLTGQAGAHALIIWSSSDTDVATVSSSGVITPTGSGSATITASFGDKTIYDTAAVTVNQKTLTIGGTFTAGNRQYDGSTAAAIDANNLTLEGGIVGGDTVALNTSAAFADANVGTGKTVSLTGSTLTGADAGNYLLSFTGAPTATADITKATGLAAPAAPTLLEKTDTSVTLTLTPDAVLEFRINGGSWQASNMFSGLNHSTAYTFTARVKESANSEASAESAGLTVTTYDITYTVTYLPNGGSGTAPTETNKPEGASFTVKNNSFTAPSGKRFKEWNTTAGGSGTAYAPDATAVMPAAALTLYAVWENIPGGGSGGGRTDPNCTASVSGGGSIPVVVNTNAGVASLDLSSLSGRLSGGGSTAVTVPSIPGVNSFTAKMPASSLSGSGEGSLILNTSAGSVTLSSDMLAGTDAAPGGTAQIELSLVDRSKLSDEARAVVGDRPVISLTLYIDGAQTDWNNPGAPATVSIPYTPTTKELENPEGIVVWYIDGSGNAVCIPSGHYDPDTGMVTFETSHFSNYAVAYNAVSFNDVSTSTWYVGAVRFIAAREITTGTGNGNYSPDAKLTRGEFLVMLMKSYDIGPDENPADNFADADNTYYTGYLAAAKRLGITSGIGSNMFAPSKKITRQELFTLLYNALKVIGQLPQGDSGKTLSNFTDADQIDAWAEEAITLLVETGTVGGSGGKLTPTDTTTRAEMAQVLYNLLAEWA